MANDSMHLLDLLRKEGASADFLREAAIKLVHDFMECEVAAQIGAHKNEHNDERITYRNGYRNREWDTRLGTLQLNVPKLRSGSYFPSILEPRRRAERAIVAVIQEAYVLGVSTRRVEELAETLGITKMDKNQVSRMCEGLDEQVQAWRTRPLNGPYPFVWLDAIYIKVRVDHRVVNQAVVVAIGVNGTGDREVLGVDVGPSEEEAFWTQFLRALVDRGLQGVQLAISDAHKGLKKAISVVLAGATWQRCRVHTMRNLLCHVSKTAQPVVAAMLRSIFVQPDKRSAIRQLRDVSKRLEELKCERAAALLLEAEEEVLAYMDFPEEMWRQLHSTNPIERLNKEIRRRSDVVGIFPTCGSLIRLVGALLIEQSEEWATARAKYFSLQVMRKVLVEKAPTPVNKK